MLASPGHCGNHRILHGHHGNRSSDVQSSSARTITLVVVPFPAGGPTGTIGRIIAEGLQSSLGQPFNHRKRAHSMRSHIIFFDPESESCLHSAYGVPKRRSRPKAASKNALSSAV
jgi:hypothetical protein